MFDFTDQLLAVCSALIDQEDTASSAEVEQAVKAEVERLNAQMDRALAFVDERPGTDLSKHQQSALEASLTEELKRKLTVLERVKVLLAPLPADEDGAGGVASGDGPAASVRGDDGGTLPEAMDTDVGIGMGAAVPPLDGGVSSLDML